MVAEFEGGAVLADFLLSKWPILPMVCRYPIQILHASTAPPSFCGVAFE